MQTLVIREAGYKEAILGLSLSYGQRWTPSDEMKAYNVALRLSSKGDGHNKFLESMCVWIDVTAPRFWWSEMDTYRVGITKQSESTMHTLRRAISNGGVQDHMFERGCVTDDTVDALEATVKYGKDIEIVKLYLPESFLQRRIICTNYKTLQTIVRQRKDHKLPQWKMFCDDVIRSLKYPEFISSGMRAQ